MENASEFMVALEENEEHQLIAMLGGVPFPIRDGWDYEGAMTATDEDGRQIIFLLREELTESGYAGTNYRRGVVWIGEGYMDCTHYPDDGTWRTNDKIYEGGGYVNPLSPMTYVEKWEGFDLAKL